MPPDPEDASVGPKALRLIRTFWSKAILVCRASGYHGSPFSAERGVTQGGPLSPTIFNIMVDAIVREWVRQMELLGIDAADIRTIVAVFYADDGLVAAREPKVLQDSFDILVGLFERVGLATNTTKTEMMIFLPGRIRTGLSEDAYLARMDALHRESRKGRRAECHVCRKVFARGSLASHLATQHGIYHVHSMATEEEDAEEACTTVPAKPATWTGIHYPATGKWGCPVPGCPQGRPGKGAGSSWDLR